MEHPQHEHRPLGGAPPEGGRLGNSASRSRVCVSLSESTTLEVSLSEGSARQSPGKPRRRDGTRRPLEDHPLGRSGLIPAARTPMGEQGEGRFLNAGPPGSSPLGESAALAAVPVGTSDSGESGAPALPDLPGDLGLPDEERGGLMSRRAERDRDVHDAERAIESSCSFVRSAGPGAEREREATSCLGDGQKHPRIECSLPLSLSLSRKNQLCRITPL